MLRDRRLYFDLDNMQRDAEQLRDEIGNAYELACIAARLEGLTLHPGDDLETVQLRVNIQRAVNVDGELDTLPSGPRVDGPRWTIDYRESGEFAATCTTTPTAEGPRRMVGYASTPTVAAHTVRHYFLEEHPTVTFDPPLPCTQPLLAEYDPDERQMDEAPPRPVDLLTADSPIYEEHLAACAGAQARLAGQDIHQALADRAAELNTADPQLPMTLGLAQAGEPRNRDHKGWVHSIQWVPSDLIVATTRRTWGEFGEHRPTVPADIAHALLSAGDLDQFTYKLFADTISLNRIPAWAGPLYTLGSNGAHRIHTARLLHLPWLATRVTAPPQPASWDMLTIIGDDSGNRATGPPERRSRNRAALIAGLIQRNIIDGELTYPRSRHYPVLHARYLPAPWLVRNAEFATRVNAVYERKHPGALEQLGIPTDVGTTPAAWTDWLTT